MQTEPLEPAGDRTWVACREPLHAGSPPPYQLSFLSPIAGATAGLLADARFLPALRNLDSRLLERDVAYFRGTLQCAIAACEGRRAAESSTRQ